MAVRLKTRWHRSKRSERNRKGSREPKTLLDLSSVIGINIWKLARETFIRMEKEGFRFKEDTQAIAFVEEFLIFQLHITDRMIFGKVAEEEREPFINAVAKNLADSLNDNQTDLLGPGQYITAFIERLNHRAAEYADCDFSDEGPSYAFIRVLAFHVAECLKLTDDKWVIEQVMDVEAPEVIEKFMPVVNQVLGLQHMKKFTPS